MALCTYCQRRKAKRHCPAMRAELCSLCCGELRQKKVHCPPSCSFLLKHEAYQQERRLQRTQEPSRNPLEEERLAWLAAQVEMSLHLLALQNKNFSDKDAALALEYAREKVAAGNPRILLPGEKPGPQSAFGEAILKTINSSRYEKGLVLPDSVASYSREDKIACLEALIRIIKNFTRGNLSHRFYLDDLARRINDAAKARREKKVLLT